MPVWQKAHRVVRFYHHDRGSCYEVQSQSYVARDVSYLVPAVCAELEQSVDEIIYDLNKVIKTLSMRA